MLKYLDLLSRTGPNIKPYLIFVVSIADGIIDRVKYFRYFSICLFSINFSSFSSSQLYKSKIIDFNNIKNLRPENLDFSFYYKLVDLIKSRS